MADVYSIKVPFDNRVQPGDTTCQNLENSFAAQGIGNKPVEQIRDPATGKLMYVLIETPAASKDAAVAAINSEIGNGVSTTVVPLPPPLSFDNLTDVTFGSATEPKDGDANLLGDSNSIQVSYAVAAGGTGIFAGGLAGNNVAPVYVDGTTRPSFATHTLFSFVNDAQANGTATWVANPNDYSLVTTGGTFPVSTTTTALGVDNPGFGTHPEWSKGWHFKAYFVDTDGKLYLHIDTVLGITNTYEQAVSAGAL